MGRMGRRQICNTLYIYIYILKIFLTAFFFRKQKKKFFYGSNMGRGTYTETDNWVAAKIS